MAVLCDFDDTIAHQNVAQLLLERFGHGEWQALREQLRRDEINFRQYQELAFDAVTAGEAEMRRYVEAETVVRSGFRQLWGYCQETNTPLAIASLGLDFYIEAVMQREGISPVAICAVETSFTPQGISYRYPYSWEGCTRWGTCKCSVLWRYQQSGHAVAYIGDGTSDFCPASKADLVFARSHLAEKCIAEGVQHHDFQDFHQVVACLKERVEEVGGR